MWCTASGSRPVASKPQCKCKNDGVFGAVASRHEPAVPRTDDVGKSFAVAHTGAFDTTCFARRSDPSFNRAPTTTPPSIIISSTCAFVRIEPPFLVMARSSAAAIAGEPPMGTSMTAPSAKNSFIMKDTAAAEVSVTGKPLSANARKSNQR